MQCAVGWIPTGTLVIAFRGTASFKNVLADIKFFSKQACTFMASFMLLGINPFSKKVMQTHRPGH